MERSLNYESGMGFSRFSYGDDFHSYYRRNYEQELSFASSREQRDLDAWHERIGYKDRDQYMVRFADRKEQVEYSKERDFVTAAINNNTVRCRCMVKEKVDVNANNSLGTALGVAARDGYYDLCEFLIIEARANVNLYNVQGETPLMQPLRSGNTEVCELLIAHGASLTKDNPINGLSLRDYAAGSKASLCFLEKHGLIEQEEDLPPKYVKNIGITRDVGNLEKDFSELSTIGEASSTFSDYDFGCVIL